MRFESENVVFKFSGEASLDNKTSQKLRAVSEYTHGTE